MTVKIQRSAVEAYQRCPRLRWEQYERVNGTAIAGYVVDKPAFALEIGGGFHTGMEVVLSAVIKHGVDAPYANPGVVEMAVEAGIERYERKIMPYFGAISTLNQAFKNDPDVGWDDDNYEEDFFDRYSVNEGRALTEAMIRSYIATPMGLPTLLDEYEVLAVEQELEAPLDKCSRCDGTGIYVKEPRETFDLGGSASYLKQMDCPSCNGTGGSLVLMSRPDGILRHKKDRQLYVLSFKTAARIDKRKTDNAKYDIEGISQIIAAEHHYGEKFAGVQMVYDIKGYKLQDKSDSRYKVHNGLVRPLLQKDKKTKDWSTVELDRLAFQSNYINEDGEPKKLTEPQGWHRVNLWEYGGDAIKDWIEYMAKGRWPRQLYGNVDMLDKTVLMPPPIWRDEASIEEWKEEIGFQEAVIASNAMLLNREIEQGLVDEARKSLAYNFPKYRHSCTYPLPCAFIPVCHQGMPVTAGGYKAREANHPNEKERK